MSEMISSGDQFQMSFFDRAIAIEAFDDNLICRCALFLRMYVLRR